MNTTTAQSAGEWQVHSYGLISYLTAHEDERAINHQDRLPSMHRRSWFRQGRFLLGLMLIMLVAAGCSNVSSARAPTTPENPTAALEPTTTPRPTATSNIQATVSARVVATETALAATSATLATSPLSILTLGALVGKWEGPSPNHTTFEVTWDGKVRDFKASSGAAGPNSYNVAISGDIPIGADLTFSGMGVIDGTKITIVGSFDNPSAAHGQIVTGQERVTVFLWNADRIGATLKPTSAPAPKPVTTPLRTFESLNSMSSAAFSPDGQTIITGVFTTAILWDVQTGEQLRAFYGHADSITSVAFSPDGKTILTGSLDQTAILWDVQTGQKLHTFSGHVDAVQGVAFSPDGKTIVTGSRRDAAILRDVASGQQLQRLDGDVWSVAFSPDSKTVLTGTENGTAILWDVATGQKLRTLSGHWHRLDSDTTVYSVAFSPDGKNLVTGGADRTAILWDVQTGMALRTFQGHTDRVDSVAFSPDGKTVLTGSPDGTAILWDAANGQRLRIFGVSGELAVSSVALSPDNKMIFTTSFGYTARLWDISDLAGKTSTPN